VPCFGGGPLGLAAVVAAVGLDDGDVVTSGDCVDDIATGRVASPPVDALPQAEVASSRAATTGTSHRWHPVLARFVMIDRFRMVHMVPHHTVMSRPRHADNSRQKAMDQSVGHC
jgi:hypothetical protein